MLNVHEGARHIFVMRGLEEGEVGSNSGCQIVHVHGPKLIFGRMFETMH